MRIARFDDLQRVDGRLTQAVGPRPPLKRRR
jgi:hypothetical protein